MNKKLTAFTKQITFKKISIVLYLLVIFHVLLTVYLLHNNQLARQAETRNQLFQKIVNTVYLLDATPLQNREKAVKAIDDSVIQVTLSAIPSFTLQIKEHSDWRILYALEKASNTFFISIQLNQNQWLNIKATLYTHIVLTQLFFMLGELLLFCVILVAFWSIKRFTSPLEKIKLSADRLGIHLDATPIDVYGPKAIQDVSQALNQMQNRILQLIRNRTQLLASISHDLRTPIMRAQLRAQFIEESDYKTKLLDDLTEMEKMISEILAFAHEETKSEEKSHIDLVSLLAGICDDATDMGSDVKFYTTDHRIGVVGRPLALKRAFTNIINNAIRYAGNAIVHITKRKKFIFIKIEDDGPGIVKADLEKVFEPFYRSEHSRSRDTGGVGLGLSVTRDIILAHQGSIQLKNKKSGGLSVFIQFPLTVSNSQAE